MERKVLFIYNPISGTRGKTDLVSLVREKMGEAGISLTVMTSRADGNYEFLDNNINENNITDVLIAGGDGTVSQVMSFLLRSNVRVGIIPCGSGNGLALAAHIPRLPAKAVDVFLTGKPVRIDGFYVNDKFACMLSGLGFDAQVAHDFANQSRRGLATYINQVIKNFFTAPYYHFDIEVGDRQFSTDAFFISVANSNQFGNNFTIAPQANLSDGLLDIVIVTHQHKLTVLLHTLKQVAGWNKLQPQSIIAGKKGVIYFQTEKLTVTNTGNAPLHIDGDPAITSERLSFRVLPQCISLIQPSTVQG